MKAEPNTSPVVVMYDSPEAAHRGTVEGWISRDGRFYGDDEHLARWAGCTHKRCDCGGIMDRGYTRCLDCIADEDRKRWEALPAVEWDGDAPLCLFDDDHFFFSPWELLEYCEDHNVKPTALRLVLAEGRRFSTLEEDYWVDDLPEDGDLPGPIADAVKKLNEVIKAYPHPAAYWPSKQRVVINPENL